MEGTDGTYEKFYNTQRYNALRLGYEKCSSFSNCRNCTRHGQVD